MQELEVASAEAHTEKALQSLLSAANAINEQDASGKILGYEGAVDLLANPFPKALSALADAALAEPTQLPHIRTEHHIPPHRTILPQPSQPPVMPTDPRSFILPQPTPTQQPRRLLPARRELGLPDPFTMQGPPQLPPLPGSNFQRLPLPGYLPPPGPPGPSMYFPPHGHAPPPPRRY